MPKIIAIGPRFINENELKYIPQNNKLYYFHVIWGAKEAMYKCHGKRVGFQKASKSVRLILARIVSDLKADFIKMIV